MTKTHTKGEKVSLRVENIGGIANTSIEFTPGVTILSGRNTTNRTSLLQAIMAALGSDAVSLKADADKGEVELQLGSTVYTRRLTRQNGTTVVEGDPYVEDPTVIDLFGFLLETNDARQAVAQGDDLRNIIMKPVDTEAIEDQIDQHRSRRDHLDDRLRELNQLEEKLPTLKEEQNRLTEDIDEKKNELSTIEAEIEDLDIDISERRDVKEEHEQVLNELNDVRSKLETVRRKISTQKESIEALREEKSDLEAERQSIDDVSQDKIEGLEAEIQRLRSERDAHNEVINKIQTIIEFNEGMLDGSLDIFNDLTNNDGPVTDQLVTDSKNLVCWTCGSTTETNQIKSMVNELKQLRDDRRDRRVELSTEIEDLTDRSQQLTEQKQKNSRIQERLDSVDDEIDERETTVTELKERRSDLTEQVESLETEVGKFQTDNDRDQELLDLHKEANRLEVEIERLEGDLEQTQGNIERIEGRLSKRESIETEREEIKTKIDDLQTRVEQIEKVATTQFNDHMESLLDILEYENLDRIWIERKNRTVKQGRRKVQKSQFDLHVVRSTDSGTVYEDTVDHLSESEREVTGLVFALAGYLVHDVSEKVPFMLIDSVEAIDAPRLDKLIEYFGDHVEYLIIALLEEDAKAINKEYNRIHDI